MAHRAQAGTLGTTGQLGQLSCCDQPPPIPDIQAYGPHSAPVSLAARTAVAQQCPVDPHRSLPEPDLERLNFSVPTKAGLLRGYLTVNMLRLGPTQANCSDKSLANTVPSLVTVQVSRGTRSQRLNAKVRTAHAQRLSAHQRARP